MAPPNDCLVCLVAAPRALRRRGKRRRSIVVGRTVRGIVGEIDNGWMFRMASVDSEAVNPVSSLLARLLIHPCPRAMYARWPRPRVPRDQRPASFHPGTSRDRTVASGLSATNGTNISIRLLTPLPRFPEAPFALQNNGTNARSTAASLCLSLDLPVPSTSPELDILSSYQPPHSPSLLACAAGPWQSVSA